MPDFQNSFAVRPILENNHAVVVPLFNERETLPHLIERLKDLHNSIKAAPFAKPQYLHFILVDDGSKDGSGEFLEALSAEVRALISSIHFSRNFGHQAAITAGIRFAVEQGFETVSVIDADLQDPPELIVDFIRNYQDGFDVVYGLRQHRDGETWFKLFTAKMFYRLMRRLTQVDIPVDAGDFRLLSRRAALAFLSMPEKHRFVRGMVAWIGFPQKALPYHRASRQFGSTHYPFRKMLKFAFDGITSFSAIPLQLATYLGFAAAVVGLVILCWSLYARFITGYTVQGWTSLMTVVLFFGAVQLMCLGVIGEYLARIYDESRQRPLFVVKNVRSVWADRPPKQSM